MYCWACREALSLPWIADYALQPWLEHQLCRVCYYELQHGKVPRLDRKRGRRRGVARSRGEPR